MPVLRPRTTLVDVAVPLHAAEVDDVVLATLCDGLPVLRLVLLDGGPVRLLKLLRVALRRLQAARTSRAATPSRD